MNNHLLVIGASGHGKVVADIAFKMNRWEKISFIDDNDNLKVSMGLDVIGKYNDVFNYINDHDIFVAIGNNLVRKSMQERLEIEGATIPTLIHPNSVIGKEVEIDSGTVVMAGVVINCCTKIGSGSIINTSSSIDHDNIIEQFVHISPGSHLAGNVRIGEDSWLGIGSIVKNNITITNNCRIGAGAVVVNDITVSGTYTGLPARRV